MTTLSCEAIRERILDGDEDPTLLAHAQTCAECQPILAALVDVDAELARLTPLEPPDALVQATLERVRAEAAREATPAPARTSPTEGAPSLLAAAFAVLTSAIGALVSAPLVALRWLLGVGTGKAGHAPPPRSGFSLASGLALAAMILGLLGVTTFSVFSVRVKSKTRGAEGFIGGLPAISSRDTSASAPPTEEVATPAASAHADLAWNDRGEAIDELREGDVDEDGRDPDAPADLLRSAERPPVFAAGLDGWRANGQGEIDREDGETLALDLPNGTPVPSYRVADDQTLDHEQTETEALEGRMRAHAADGTELLPDRGIAARGTLGFDQSGDFEQSSGEAAARTAPDGWDLAQATSGLSFASSQSWWANTYVPGDARLRVLHSRLASAPSPLPGTTLSALALAELASPTVPAVAAPSDRAIALGVHADTTAIEGPTRVRLEIALRAIDQAAGRRGALRIALVVDARGGLDADETAHLRSLLAALSRSLSPRDRVILTAAGPGGGTLVPLGVLRHGQVEVALRHLADTSSITGEAIPTSLESALGAGLEAVANLDDGAGLVMLATPDGAHDDAVDQALHLGAVAGVPTTAVAIGSAASTASLDAIALAGEGRRRSVLSDDDAARAVREELVAASRLVARALRVRVRLADGVQLVDVVGSHALDAEETRRTRESERAIDQELARRLGIGQDRDEDDSGVRILVPSFYAGDSHTIVLDLLVTRPGPVADVDVRFKDLVRLGNGTASSALALEAGTAPRGPHELRVVASYVGHEVAGALDDAADALERGDVRSAHTRLAATRLMLDRARSAVDGLDALPSITADATLLDRFVTALGSVRDPQLVASSLHYAAARRVVTPQLQASTP